MNDGQPNQADANLSKRRRVAADGRFERARIRHLKLSHDDYTIGWIAALPIELAAAKAMLDTVHETLPNDPNDINTYTLGAVEGHNVVMACLPSDGYGLGNAAIVASNMKRSYPSVYVQLVVGIGGGVPCQADVRLGDVVVGHTVIQHDLGKKTGPDQFELVGTPCRPPSETMTALAALRAAHEINQCSRMSAILADMLERYPSMTSFANTSQELQDWLYESDYDHVGPSDTCIDCDPSRRVTRAPRPSSTPKIHYGAIASGNQVIKHGRTRDQLAQSLRKTVATLPPVLCVEMEAAGLRGNYKHLVIRGICDYADSHKNKQWQSYAAGTAAAYARELLSVVPLRDYHAQLLSLQGGNAPTSDHQVANHRQTLLKSLSFEQIESRYDDIRAPQATTCEWFLQDERYLDWLKISQLSQHHGFLWIKGKPGVGKSTIMKFLYEKAGDNANLDAPTRQEVIMGFFFNARGAHLEKSTMGMYRSLLYQLLQRMPELLDILDDIADTSSSSAKDSKVDSKWDLKVLRKLLTKAVSRIGQRHVVVYIDALDECDEEEVQEMVEHFELMGKRAFQTGSRLHVCFSSRHYPFITIEKGIELILETQSGHADDLKKYVQSKLGKLSSSKSVQEITLEITEKSAGVFLWAVLVIQIVEKEIKRGRIDRIKARVQELPPKLSDLFKDMLRRDHEDMDSLVVCVQWLLFALKPLKPEELYFATMSHLSPEDSTAWDRDIITEEDIERFVLSSSKGLAEVAKSEGGASRVQFIHETVRDFLLKDNGFLEIFQEVFPELNQDLRSVCHERLKTCCQTYIHTDVSACVEWRNVSLKSSTQTATALRDSLLAKFPFLNYATYYMLDHANEASKVFPQESFLRNVDLVRLLGFRKILDTHRVHPFYSAVSPHHMLNDNEIAEFLISGLDTYIEHPLTEPDTCRTSLLAAIAAARWATVREMIQGGANIKVQDGNGRTALHYTVVRGHDETVRLLIERGADIEARDQDGRTPLSIAFIGGHEQLLQLLVEKGAVVEVQDNKWGRPKLSIHYHLDSTVQLLIENGADIEAEDKKGRKPLIHAIQNGLDSTAQILIRSGANTDVRDAQGRNLLMLVSAQGLDGTIRLLASRGADVEVCDVAGATSLHLAAANRHESTIRVLVELGANINTRAHSGQSLLATVIGKGLESSARFLLDRGAIESDEDNFFMIALENGYHRIVKLLLERGADVNGTDERYGTFLQAAAAKGLEQVVELLLHWGANVNAQGGAYGNALQAAAYQAHDEIASILIARGADVNMNGGPFGTALLAACATTTKSGHQIVQLLVDNGADVNVRSFSHGTPLQVACYWGGYDNAKYLLDNGADANAQAGPNGKSALETACTRGHADIGQLLSRRGDDDHNSNNDDNSNDNSNDDNNASGLE